MSDIKKFGFGLMRLPKRENGKIDIEETKRMVDLFMSSGFNYFDTAYVYDDGESEKAAKAALVDRYPRGSFYLATKMNAKLSEEDAKQQFFISLERTGAGYFDYYLLHALQPGSYKRYDEFGLWDFVKEQKAKGLINHIGFSFHATPEILEEVLNDHPETEFVQLQINYVDWENPSVESKKCYEIVRRFNKPIIIMEPLKGGKLAEPIQEARIIFKLLNPEASFASWAIRYCAGLPGVITVLSGMSDISQMQDNISFMQDFKPLGESEAEAIREVQTIIRNEKSIPCTGCGYCLSDCPQGIPIPEIFKARNKGIVLSEIESKAASCIKCGKCEVNCPQHILIRDKLK